MRLPITKTLSLILLITISLLIIGIRAIRKKNPNARRKILRLPVAKKEGMATPVTKTKNIAIVES